MADFQEDENHQYLTMAAPAAIAEWMLHDVWDAETACQLVVLGYKLPRPAWKALKELDAADALDLPEVWNKLRERYASDASDEREIQEIQDALDSPDVLDVRDIRDAQRWLGMLVEQGALNPQFVRTICAVYDRAKAIADSSVNAGTIREHDTPENWRRWAQGKGYSVAHLMLTDALAAKVEAGAVITVSGDDKPWLVANPTDPAPDYSWYTPARYFARQLVKDDSTLRAKRKKLAEKTAKLLASAGVFARGKKKQPLCAGTVLKSFVNVMLN